MELHLFWILSFVSSVFHVMACENTPSGLLCNLMSQPELTVITTPQPQFGWVVPTGNKNEKQKAYRILVASSIQLLNDNIGDFWDSGKQDTSQSQHVLYNGKKLQPWSTYYWKVAFWDKNNNESSFSRPQQFNTGEFGRVRSWPGESRWVKIENGTNNSWTLEDRTPIRYHKRYPQKIIRHGESKWFIDFKTSTFAYATFLIHWPETEANEDMEKIIKVSIGEKAIGDSIDRVPGGGVLFKEYSLKIKPGKHEYTLEIPRFVSNYPHSQEMPNHMLEVIPFRYCEVDCDSESIILLSVAQHAPHTVFDDHASSFSSSSDLLNKIYDLCKYSVKVNTFNGDYAASQRERMMYEADSYIHQMGHYAVDREFSVARYSLKNMIFHATWPTEWISHSIMMAWADYLYTGNSDIIEEFYDDLKHKTLIALTTDKELISTRTGLQNKEFLASIYFNGSELRDIVDWPHGSMSELKGGETDNFDFQNYNTVVNAFHYHTLILMSKIAEALNKKNEAALFTSRALKVKNAFNHYLFDTTNEIYVDGIGSTHASLHSNMFALAFDLVPDSKKEKVIEHIKSKGMACSVYGANYLLEALFDAGEAEYAQSLLTSTSDRSWYNMIRKGSTMTTEAWDNKYKSNNGWSHAWSSSPVHILPRKLMGIEPLAPGFKSIQIKPAISSLEWASVKLPTIRGEIRAKYTRAADHFNLFISIPGNTSAKVLLPAKQEVLDVLINKIPTKDYEINDQYIVINNIGSGEHEFEVKYNLSDHP